LVLLRCNSDDVPIRIFSTRKEAERYIGEVSRAELRAEGERIVELTLPPLSAMRSLAIVEATDNVFGQMEDVRRLDNDE
jgi:hypothetical protein